MTFSPNRLTITFNNPIVAETHSTAPWFVVYAGMNFTVLSAVTAAGKLRLNLGGASNGYVGSYVNHTPPPYDVHNAGGLTTAPFSDYPVHT
jgi:hypothetical protein